MNRGRRTPRIGPVGSGRWCMASLGRAEIRIEFPVRPEATGPAPKPRRRDKKKPDRTPGSKRQRTDLGVTLEHVQFRQSAVIAPAEALVKKLRPVEEDPTAGPPGNAS